MKKGFTVTTRRVATEIDINAPLSNGGSIALNRHLSPNVRAAPAPDTAPAW